MNTSVYLLLILALSLIIIAYLVSVLLRVRIQLTLIKDALEDIKNGNLNRRILT
ncbi:sensor histidine kinase, partial [Clostridioides difficile]|nr:sensor histidine kinase [Clostridioides difficile]